MGRRLQVRPVLGYELVAESCRLQIESHYDPRDSASRFSWQNERQLLALKCFVFEASDGAGEQFR